jgi:predicted transcriptional regulator
MLFGLFGKKEDNSDLKQEIKQSFNTVKQDIKKAAEWIAHLNSRDKQHENDIEAVNGRLSSVENELSEIKTFISFFDSRISKQMFKQQRTGVYKQTAVQGVQTPVQTGVYGVQTAIQSAFLGNLSVMERAIVWVLLNTDMKLSYEDIATILNKDKATIRGQINAIKQKSEGIVDEVLESNGKKRYFIGEEMREMLLNKIKLGQGLKKAKGKHR